MSAGDEQPYTVIPHTGHTRWVPQFVGVVPYTDPDCPACSFAVRAYQEGGDTPSYLFCDECASYSLFGLGLTPERFTKGPRLPSAVCMGCLRGAAA